MFSGIVEEIGMITNLRPTTNYTQFTIQANRVLTDVKIGDSIAVNGVCLTVISFTSNSFDIQAVPETLAKTNLKFLNTGTKVNLERSILPTTRLGGHMVQGHVDTTCQLLNITTDEHGTIATFSLPAELQLLLIKKGYVALDGMSLTVVDCNKQQFSIAFIPHTIAATIVQYYQPDQHINIEADMAGKYIHQFMSAHYE
jgi:riboflavin synthase